MDLEKEDLEAIRIANRSKNEKIESFNKLINEMYSECKDLHELEFCYIRLMQNLREHCQKYEKELERNDKKC